MIARLGAFTVSLLQDLGSLKWMLGKTIAESVERVSKHRAPFPLEDLLHQANRVGVGSVPMVVLLSFFVGLTMALLTGYQLQTFGLATLVPSIVAITFSREMAQQGMMGLQEIDFVHGDISSGLAENHADFIGTRVPDVSEAVEGMVADVKRLTGPDSDLGHTINNLRGLTAPNSSLALTLANLKDLTGPNADLALTLHKTKTFMQTLNDSKMTDVIKNADQFTDTIKRQPWRLIWPSTKTYPNDPVEPHQSKKAMPAAPAMKTANSLAAIKHD